MKWLNISLGRAEVRFTILEDRSKETLHLILAMPISRRIDKEAVVHIHHGILLSH